MPREPIAPTEIFKALADPIRWSIIQQVAQEEEFPCSVLEDTLPVSKPTISYHTKILTQAGLIEVHKRGRNYFYSLRRDILREVIEQLWPLAPGSPPAGPAGAPGGRAAADREEPAAAAEADAGAPLITW
ncbi:ArsR/SmtB family transcription factor [Actinomadura sp. NTSP31]|uniref:ArsR/SmtB family transcription factor n=1 Tax=Actinomadura sp. NTSP31 TaxID=1735447 RepID=UPI0035C06C75